MPKNPSLEKSPLAECLLSAIRKVFESVNDSLNPPDKDPRGKQCQIPLVDCLMSGLAVFGLKFPSLLQFSDDREAEITKHNLETLYKVKQAPCDTYMRERLDAVDPKEMRKAFTTIFTKAQRSKVLEDYQYIDGYYLLLNDGTGVFESDSIHCKNCCKKTIRMDEFLIIIRYLGLLLHIRIVGKLYHFVQNQFLKKMVPKKMTVKEMLPNAF